MQVRDQGFETRYLERDRVGIDRIADLHKAFGDDAVDRRPDFRVAVLQSGEIVRGLERFRFVLDFLEVSGADQASFLQIDVALVVALRLAQIGLGLLEFETQAVAVETSEHLPACYVITFFDENLTDFTGDLRNDLSLSEGLDRCRARVHRINIGAARERGFYRDCGGVVFGLFGLRPICVRGALRFRARLAGSQQYQAENRTRQESPCRHFRLPLISHVSIRQGICCSS